jgi:MoxR-like ATPase
MTNLPNYRAVTPVEMPQQGIWPRAVHRFDDKTVVALRMAEVTGRPLLMRGLPGVGKSQTARAAAAFAERPFLAHVIDARTEPHDLMWRFDQVRRLADAQVGKPGKALPKDRAYLSPQTLWWAFDWNQAQRLLRGGSPPLPPPAGWQADRDRAVVLIDEIDKADPELPNALLEVLSANGFRVPFTGQDVRCDPSLRPLILITTNEERELPQPFLRRCLVRVLELPSQKDNLIAELSRIGVDHQDWLNACRPEGERLRCEIIGEVAARVADERLQRLHSGDYLPGTAEFLDLVNALAALEPGDATKQRQMLKDIGQFALKKSALLGDA